ncbi:MAG: hypothetical protein NTX44_08285 [Ignavibacteriales bacterium]|nr:hypothetical protein [Ignavibacteriales bacterium]
MSIMMDYIAAAIIFGILALTVAREQTNINVMMYQNTFRFSTQTNATALARQIEHDFLKMGYHVKGQRIFVADNAHIKYRADITNAIPIDTILVEYSIGTPAQDTKGTKNPRDFPLFRSEKGGTPITQNFGLSKFNISYFDSLLRPMTSTPYTVPESLAKIRFIDVSFLVESPEPVDPITGDTTQLWSRISWEKQLVPRNLNNVNF